MNVCPMYNTAKTSLEDTFLHQPKVILKRDMGGCQNYGPSLDPHYNAHLIFRVPKKGP